MEIPKRLTPTPPVTRSLYLASGNRCAYPGCDQPLMTADGVLVGEIAHIEGPLKGSPRFRKTMTNEQRRAYANLVLMCATCHTIIDRDLDAWPVEKLRELKGRHEAVYTGAVDQLRQQVGDLTEGTPWTAAANLGRLPGVQGQTPDELEWSVQVVNKFAARLAGRPVGARSIIAISSTVATQVDGAVSGNQRSPSRYRYSPRSLTAHLANFPTTSRSSTT